MKTYFKYILAPAVIAVGLTGCFDLATPGSDTEESIQATYNEAVLREAADIGCKFSDRKTVSQVTNMKGIIKMLSKEQTREAASFAIHIPETNQRYTACDLPDYMQREGVAVIFSGDVKEIFPNERWMATPFEIRSIELQQPIRKLEDDRL